MSYFTHETQPESNILITCEHGSSHIPAKHLYLGLSQEELVGAKDWYDIGALQLAGAICNELDTNLVAATISRMFVDANRRLDGVAANPTPYHTDILKTKLLTVIDGKEKMVEIPGNKVPNHKEEEKRRWMKYVLPYQEKGLEMVSDIKKKHGRAWMFQIHSFFPVYNGEKRDIDIDVMFTNETEKEGTWLIDWLEKNSDYKIGLNAPWDMHDIPGVFDSVVEDPDVTLLEFDVNDDHLRDEVGIQKVGALLSQAIAELVAASS